MDRSLVSRRILVVEDEYLLAQDAQEALVGSGYKVLGPVPNQKEAFAALERDRPDAVVLDLNLDGDISTGLAEHLRREGIPFVIVTGYGESHVRGCLTDGAPWIGKPYDTEHLLSTLAGVLQA
jgi:DNA-binding response OmpR family regulator